MVASPDVNYIITVIGLMWEHINFEEYDLRKIIVKFLSRIGYPSRRTLKRQELPSKEP